MLFDVGIAMVLGGVGLVLVGVVLRLTWAKTPRAIDPIGRNMQVTETTDLATQRTLDTSSSSGALFEENSPPERRRRFR
jgi:hypothetical protein